MDVMINETKMNLPPDVATWGDLLDWVEMNQLKPGQCITRVMFQGKEEIQYRNSLLCDRGIEEVGPVQIESGEFDTVVKETFTELQKEIGLALENIRDI